MAAKKKMSVADILAAARKADGDAAKSQEETSDAPAPETSSGVAAVQASPAAKTVKPSAVTKGDRPSVADIMAMARSGETPAEKESPPAKKPSTATTGKKTGKPPAKPAASKAKPSAQPAAKTNGPKDTASILAAARKPKKSGPVSKSEAAAAVGGAVVEAAAKPKAVAPPMPAKPDYAKPRPKSAAASEDRRGFVSLLVGSFLGLGFTSFSATMGLWTLGTARFMFPNILVEPPNVFKVGPPDNYAPGFVETKYKAQFGVWVVNSEYQGEQQIYALKTVCTHLGCTPNWLEAEQKFKCPCHGSGFYKDGVNFEGPAPRPLERYVIRLADDGQLEIDKSRIFQQEMGQWNDTDSFVAV